jgi:hypothetical protein
MHSRAEQVASGSGAVVYLGWLIVAALADLAPRQALSLLPRCWLSFGSKCGSNGPLALEMSCGPVIRRNVAKISRVQVALGLTSSPPQPQLECMCQQGSPAEFFGLPSAQVISTFGSERTLLTQASTLTLIRLVQASGCGPAERLCRDSHDCATLVSNPHFVVPWSIVTIAV